MRVRGLELRVSVRGAGSPLLLLMGLGGNVEMWDPLREHLQGFLTIAFDAPGTGESDTPRLPLRMPQLADLAAEVLAELGHERVDVLGVSYGGAIAQELAHRHPAAVNRLVLAATTCGVGALPAHPATLALLATPYRYYSRAHFKAIAQRLYGGEIGRRPELLDRQAYARLVHAPSVRGYVWQLASIAGWTSLPYLWRLRQPTLVLTGEEDPIVRPLNGRLLARLLPNSKLHLLPGAGHLFLIDQPVESAGLIRAFLARERG